MDTTAFSCEAVCARSIASCPIMMLGTVSCRYCLPYAIVRRTADFGISRRPAIRVDLPSQVCAVSAMQDALAWTVIEHEAGGILVEPFEVLLIAVFETLAHRLSPPVRKKTSVAGAAPQPFEGRTK